MYQEDKRIQRSPNTVTLIVTYITKIVVNTINTLAAIKADRCEDVINRTAESIKVTHTIMGKAVVSLSAGAASHLVSVALGAIRFICNKLLIPQSWAIYNFVFFSSCSRW